MSESCNPFHQELDTFEKQCIIECQFSAILSVFMKEEKLRKFKKKKKKTSIIEIFPLWSCLNQYQFERNKTMSSTEISWIYCEKGFS